MTSRSDGEKGQNCALAKVSTGASGDSKTQKLYALQVSFRNCTGRNEFTQHGRRRVLVSAVSCVDVGVVKRVCFVTALGLRRFFDRS